MADEKQYILDPIETTSFITFVKAVAEEIKELETKTDKKSYK